MAKKLSKHLINTVQKSFLKAYLLAYLYLFLSVSSFAAIYFTYKINIIFIAAFLISAIAFFLLFKRFKKQAEILSGGFGGEKDGLKLLMKLPNGFFIINDVTLCVKNKTAQIDNIIIGPTGIFVIEIKNLNGHIVGSIHDETLKKIKHLKNGEKQVRSLYNPLMQVSTHSRLLNELLEIGGFDKKSYYGVYFANKDTVISLTDFDKNTPIFSKADGGQKLLDYILKSRVSITKSQVKELKKYIFSHCK